MAQAHRFRLQQWPLFLVLGALFLAFTLVQFATTDLGPLFRPLAGGLYDAPIIPIIRYTWRWAALFFLLSFIARPLQQLMRSSFSQWLLANRRYFGLLFALALAVQMLTIFIVLEPQHPERAMRGIVHFWGEITYFNVILAFILAITSFPGISRHVFDPVTWRRVHGFAMFTLAAYFTHVWAGEMSRGPNVAACIYLAAFGVAWVLRFMAWRDRRNRRGSAGHAQVPGVGLGTAMQGTVVVAAFVALLLAVEPY